MGKPENDVERVIVAAIWQHSRGDPAALARMIIEELWEAGYDVTRRLDMIPIRYNSGENATSFPYTAEQESKARCFAPAELFRRLADEPCNAQIAGEIRKIAGCLPKGAQSTE
jgi:hypothetical protein